MLILLAEDDERLGKLVQHFLQEEDYTVDWVLNGTDADYYTRQLEYDLIILDWMMPELSGIDVCRKLRKRDCRAGIVMLTARDSVEDRVDGLEAGADDYIVKPFALEELLARIKAVMRRSESRVPMEFLTVGTLRMNRRTKQVFYNNQEIEMTNRESSLLEILMLNKGYIVERQQLFDKIWGSENVGDNTLDVVVRRLRSKLDAVNCLEHIQTIRGIGYRLESNDV